MEAAVSSAAIAREASLEPVMMLVPYRCLDDDMETAAINAASRQAALRLRDEGAALRRGLGGRRPEAVKWRLADVSQPRPEVSRDSLRPMHEVHGMGVRPRISKERGVNSHRCVDRTVFRVAMRVSADLVFFVMLHPCM